MDAPQSRLQKLIAYALSKKTEAQALLLTIGVFAVFAACYGIFYSETTRNFYLGGSSFIQGLNPYEETLKNGPADQFKYSPFFALIFAGLDKFTLTKFFVPMIGTTVFVNILIFFYGLSRWSNLLHKQKNYVWVAALAAGIDLLTSLQGYHVNALIAGLCLIGLADYRDGKFFQAGAILMLATNLKVYPVLFLLALFVAPAPKKFWQGAILAGLAVYFLPSFFVGNLQNFEMHKIWFGLVLHDGSKGEALLNLPTAFARVGWPALGQVLRWAVICLTLPIFFSYVRVAKNKDWRPWITQGLSTLILLSPRTEVYTFALLAPAYLMMAQWCAESLNPKTRIWGGVGVAFLAVMIASCRYTDPEWFHSEGSFEIVRIVGTFGLWVFATALVAKCLVAEPKAFFSLKKPL